MLHKFLHILTTMSNEHKHNDKWTQWQRSIMKKEHNEKEHKWQINTRTKEHEFVFKGMLNLQIINYLWNLQKVLTPGLFLLDYKSADFAILNKSADSAILKNQLTLLKRRSWFFERRAERAAGNSSDKVPFQSLENFKNPYVVPTKLRERERGNHHQVK